MITSSGYEADFVAEYLDGRRQVIQVALDISRPDTHERELRALVEAGPDNNG
jgi:hypothetical protein